MKHNIKIKVEGNKRAKMWVNSQEKGNKKEYEWNI